MPFDTRETQKLINALRKAPDEAIVDSMKVMKKGATEIKKALQADAKKSRHFGQLAPTITYDLSPTATGLDIEIGPDKDRAVRSGRPGPLANIAYFGGANGGGGTLDFDAPAEAEFKTIDAQLRKIGVRTL